MTVSEEILNRIEEHQEEWLRLLSDLVRRPSENPPGATRAVVTTGAWISISAGGGGFTAGAGAGCATRAAGA